MIERAPRLNLSRRKMTPEMIKGRRTALVSLSLALLLYALAGGHVRDQATWLNLPLSFDRPWVLLAAAWVIWVYLIFRYVLVASTTSLEELRKDIRIHAMNHRWVHQMSIDALTRTAMEDPQAEEVMKHLQSGYRFGIGKSTHGYHFISTQLYRPSSQSTPAGGTSAGTISLTPLEAWKYRFVLLLAAMKATLFENTFSDEILPLALVAITPIVWIVSYWHHFLAFCGYAT